MTGSVPEHDPQETLARIRAARAEFPDLAGRIERGLLIELHKRGIARVDEIRNTARSRAESDAPIEEAEDDNVAITTRLDAAERAAVSEITLELAADCLTPADVDDIVNLQRKREEAQSLEEIANLPNLSFWLLADRVRAFAALPRGQIRLPESEAMAVRVALIRNFISDQLEFIGVARRNLTIRNFDELIDRIVGDDRGMGRIGGKAAGLMLARCILRRAQANDPDAPEIEIGAPESWYVRTDVFERFVEHAGLSELQSHKYKDPEEIRAEYPLIVELMKNADFPPDIQKRLGRVVEEAGEGPLIVRSSSLLEDRFGVSFAGKYRSIFIANQGSVDERLAELIGAIAEVYASTMHPDAMSYRVRHNLIDFSENMAVLIQKVVGQRYGKYFLPTWAGVAFSRNEYRRNPRLKPEDGVARVVLGLGTRAVDRVSSDFPRMVPLGAPTQRSATHDVDITRNSQRLVDVINLEKGKFETIEFSQLLTDEWMPGLDVAVSYFENGFLRRPVGAFVNADPEDMVLTFDRWACDTQHPADLRWVLKTLEKAYGQPVDIEWAYDGKHFHMLQCRPQAVRGKDVTVEFPEDVPADRQVFSADRDLTSALVPDLEYVVLVDPAAYDGLEDRLRKLEVARVVHALNHRLVEKRFILMGPGRWGSKDPGLGVKIGYADMCNTRMLIEVSSPLSGFVPEVSFGSHFFQDLIESRIEYLALYPDEEGAVYDRELLHELPNALTDLLPDFAEFEDVVRVIHVPSVRNGRLLRVVMDGESQRALAYLSRE